MCTGAPTAGLIKGFTALVPGRPQNAPGDIVPGEKAVTPDGTYPFGRFPLPLVPLLEAGGVRAMILAKEKACRRCSSDWECRWEGRIGVIGMGMRAEGVFGCIWDNDGSVVLVAVMRGGRKLNGGMEGVIGGRP
jgi:hypothetical protein